MIKDASKEQLRDVVDQAAKASVLFRKISANQKAKFLRVAADKIEALGNPLIQTAATETHLPEARLTGERGRTTSQLRMFADIIEEGSWVDARIDTADSARTPVPKPDLRKMRIPLGPVVVFGASNFPLAYSAAGGDTASALAAGCPVIVKAHPAHPKTSEMVANAIKQSAMETGMPDFVYQHVHGASFEVGQYLVTQSEVKAVGFTGSFTGGKALFDLANQREEPIPVFAEMGSVNPVFLFPDKMKEDPKSLAANLAGSITLGVGQFCTNPGLIIALENSTLQNFYGHLSDAIVESLPGDMLHDGIVNAYTQKMTNALSQKGVEIVAVSAHESGKHQGRPTIAMVPAQAFIKNHHLHEEIFGPFSLIVQCQNENEVKTVAGILKGQLTASIHASLEELDTYSEIISIASERCGRIIFNGVPTGVEVGAAMQHGGPFPATTDSRFSAVGRDAIQRFSRPLAWQNFPDTNLPPELQNANPFQIWRLVNNQWTKDPVK